MQKPKPGQFVIVNLGATVLGPRQVNGGNEFPALVVQEWNGDGEFVEGEPAYINCTTFLPGAVFEAGWSLPHKSYAEASGFTGAFWRWP